MILNLSPFHVDSTGPLVYDLEQFRIDLQIPPPLQDIRKASKSYATFDCLSHENYLMIAHPLQLYLQNVKGSSKLKVEIISFVKLIPSWEDEI